MSRFIKDLGGGRGMDTVYLSAGWVVRITIFNICPGKLYPDSFVNNTLLLLIPPLHMQGVPKKLQLLPEYYLSLVAKKWPAANGSCLTIY